MPASSSSQIAAGPKIHQLWQAVILKPFKLQECILHFWKPLIFINLVSAGQDHSYVLNTRFWLQKRSTFHRACVIGVYILFSMTVHPWQSGSFEISIGGFQKGKTRPCTSRGTKVTRCQIFKFLLQTLTFCNFNAAWGTRSCFIFFETSNQYL